MVKYKNIFILVFMAIFLFSCQTGKEDAKQFSDEYTKITEQLRDKRGKVTTRDDYVGFKEDRKKAYETLLKQFEKSPAIEEIEILRSKLLLGLEKLDEAEKKIDRVLAKKPDLIAQAKMVKVRILIERKKYGEAYDIFKDIESQITDLYDLFEAYYYLGSVHEDDKVKEEYSRKFLEAKLIPGHYVKFKAFMYSNLAKIAKQEGDLDKTRRLFNEGIADTKDERTKTYLEKSLAQLDYYGQQAFPISALHWVNSSPLKLDTLKGDVVIISFWAPWCPGCRTLTPTLVEMYNENKDKGFTIIGLTRLYGKYEDDEVDKGKVGKDEELELIKKYLERKKVSYPIAIADEKSALDKYKISALPTLVFIDKKGNIDYTKIGAGSIPFIKNKVKELLEKI
ncbi:MAG: redoxin domain-containing protein [Candidatus Aminicenantes bacterium]|nr:redoxin domain-containing protein [Candidatus Aminicenantes bacterium]NIM79273.1 redoxin domain-containing protein [Candidatus Aminicenantes bacterium]NIN18559.1 redoxin domain-containing protein [Candidatus Aminicenantes bacterium]NIN42456.1 redoxin domain-containing protein [Candidatus Aminicenantes bacterium]NIN85214.1 redoxin domain-containing protein [Candidatus Aminicenantes bacterium]